MGRAVVKGGYAMDSTGALLSSQGQRFSTANFSVEIFSAPPMQGYKFCWASPNAVLSVAGRHAHISICSEKSPGLLFAIAKVLEVHNLAMVHQYVSSDSFKDVIMIHIKVSHASSFPVPMTQEPGLIEISGIIEQAMRDYGQLVETQIDEQVFKSALDDIMQLIS